MTRLMRYFGAPTIAVLTLLSGSPAATASTGDDPPAAPPWPPADTNGEFVPAPDEYYAPQEAKACGTTVKVTPGDVRKTKYKATHADDGSIRIVYRGKATVDITRPDGATIDELDISGRTSQHYGPDGLSVTLKVWGPNMIWATNEVEVKELAKQGLPAFLYFKAGKLAAKAKFADATQSSVVSLDTTHNSVKGARDVCKMLDRALAERHGELG
ncbi:hypothetical protein [Arthrobacter sp. D3-16]